MEIIFLILVALLGGFTGGWHMHRKLNTDYKERWRIASGLDPDPLLELEGDSPKLLAAGPRSDKVNGWTIDQYTKPLVYITGDTKGRKFTGVALRLKKGRQVIPVDVSMGSSGLNPADPDFEKDMQKYRAKAIAVAQTL